MSVFLHCLYQEVSVYVARDFQVPTCPTPFEICATKNVDDNYIFCYYYSQCKDKKNNTVKTIT